MIEVTYYRRHNRVTVKGHAGSAPEGEDLICAAASILSYTLAERVLSMAENGEVRDPVTNLDEGNAEIQCRPSHKYRNVVTLVFDSIVTGYEILAQFNPGHVKFTMRGG